MPERIHFYMDEHVPRAVTEGLRRRGVDVLTVQDAGLLSAADRAHIELAAQQGRVLFTQDTDFLRLHDEGVPHAGIVYAAQRAPVGRMLRGLMLIHDVLTPQEMRGHVEFL